MAQVILEHITKVFPPHVCALRDLNLCVADGELMVLVGPSGCGKTTLLRLIAGLEQPTQGTLRIGARVVTAAPARDRDVAMVFQKHALYPHLNVQGNLALALKLRERRGWRRLARGPGLGRPPSSISVRVAEAARLLGLEALLDRYPHQLSGGQQQRVALGRALVRNPAVFLFDEPLSQLDVQLRMEMRRELHLLHRRLRATMIYVTHDPVEAMALADRVAVLDNGILQQVDSPAVVYAAPCNKGVASFFGWPAMNLIDGLLVRQDETASFRPAGGLTWFPLKTLPPSTTQMVTFGIRPEDVRLLPAYGNISKNCGDEVVASKELVLRMQVGLVEPLPQGSLVTLQRDTLRLTCKVQDRQLFEEGQPVDALMDMTQAHLFDGASGQALCHGMHGE